MAIFKLRNDFKYLRKLRSASEHKTLFSWPTGYNHVIKDNEVIIYPLQFRILKPQIQRKADRYTFVVIHFQGTLMNWNEQLIVLHL